jgi:hypothetical protein
MMSRWIDRIANSATEDNANVKAAVWLVMMAMTMHMMLVVAMVSMMMHRVLVPMMAYDAMPPCMRRRSMVPSMMLLHAVMLPSTLMSSVVSQRWS